MNKKVKVVLNLFIALMVLLSMAVFTGCEKKEAGAKKTFKIGMIAPLTGDMAQFGEAMKFGITFAQEQSKKDTRYNYELVFEDDQFDPKKTATALKKLINVDKVDAVVSCGGSAGNIVSPIAAEKGIVHFGITSDQRITKGDTNFLHWTPSYQQTDLLISEIYKRGHRKMVTFRMQSDAWKDIEVNMYRSAEKFPGVEIVQNNVFQGSERDFRNIIAKAMQVESDIFVILTIPPQVEILYKQMKEAGVTKPITSIESFEIAKEVDLFEGMWFVSNAAPSTDFATSYKERFGVKHGMFSPNCYDIYNLIVASTEKAAGSSSKPSAAEIAKELKKMDDYVGVLGELDVLDSGLVVSPADVKMWKNGVLTRVAATQ